MLEINSGFFQWLVLSKKISNASAGDVLSRINRVNGFIDLNPQEEIEKLLYLVSVRPEFKGCSQSVKSQLRRAIKLYKEYAQNWALVRVNEL